MKRSFKIGLAGSLAYTALTFAPSLVGVAGAVRLWPHQSSTDVKQITTEQGLESAENTYHKKLVEYASDKLLTSDEIKNLHTMQGEMLDILNTEKKILETEYIKKYRAKTEKLDEEINKYKQQLKNEESKGNKPLDELRKKLEETISEYYPALLNKDKWPVTYSAETMLKPELITSFRSIVVEADRILKEQYGDNHLEPLLKVRQYIINDILILYNAITKEREKTHSEVQEAELKKKITALEHETYEIDSSPQILPLKNKIKKYDAEIGKKGELIRCFEDYFILEKQIQEFEERYGNFNKEFAISAVKEVLLKERGLERIYDDVKSDSPILSGYEKRFETSQDNMISGLETYVKSEGLEVEIERLRNPAKTRLPWWLAQIVLGMGVPVVRNLLVKGYVRGSKAEGFEYFMSAIAGFGNGCLGGLITDGLHPLAYPARLIITPLIFQPIFRISKWYPFENI